MTNDNIIVGFMVCWDVKGDEQNNLFESLKSEGNWRKSTIGGNSIRRTLDKEFGVSVKWGRTMIIGLFLDALLSTSNKERELMPNEMWQEALSYAITHRTVASVKPKIFAFVLASLNEGGFERVAEFHVDNAEPTINPKFLEVLALHK